MQKLSQNEINERVAVLKRFKTLLERQRDKFREYLSVLEKQQTSITEENTDALIAHTELEQQVVSNIAGLQKVIVPMAEMYSSIRSSAPEGETRWSVLKTPTAATEACTRKSKASEALSKCRRKRA